jgi:GT2 family glycosyltransferase
MPTEYPLVYCVILNMNGRELLLETVESVSEMVYPNFKIVVVDNGSTDGSQPVVKSKYSSVTLIENGENLGFGGGNNVGIKYALDRGADWIFLLNNDIKVDKNLLAELIKVARSDERIGLLAPKIYYYSEPEKIWYAGGKVNFWTGNISHRGLRKKDVGQYDEVINTDYITGCALLSKREVVEKVGMFDPVYHPIYSEDTDLSERTRRNGFRLVYVPQAKLWHKVSAFSGGGLTPFKTRLKVEHNLIFFKRYARWYHWLTIVLCVGFMTMIFLIKQLCKGNVKIIGALGIGFISALKRLKQ